MEALQKDHGSINSGSSGSNKDNGSKEEPSSCSNVVPLVSQEENKQQKQQQSQPQNNGENTKDDDESKLTTTTVEAPHAATMNGSKPQEQKKAEEVSNGSKTIAATAGGGGVEGGGDAAAADGEQEHQPPPHGYTSRLPTPSSQAGGGAVAGTTTDGATTSERKRFKQHQQQQQHHHHYPLYGIPISVKQGQGRFPEVGSTLGPFFCLGQLGKGTFSSIHKCINLEYFRGQEEQEQNNQSQNPKQQPPVKIRQRRRRLAAAKVELSTFAQSGVLESEAAVLEFLHKSTPPATVPVYMGHYKSGGRGGYYAALLMEYLPGQDMHQLRESIMAQSHSRRLAVQDAVYLCANVMLPLLQRMHQVGIVHRDVKPSNCVRSGCGGDDDVNNHADADGATAYANGDSSNSTSTDNNKSFCLVDFGLSKSIVVPADSPLADKEHVWPEGRDWLKPQNYTGAAHYRQERKKAEFRGTSMYASLRVHQLKDYCPRDDIWSVLYVFCDLVSGGLPWMSYAAARNRDACQKVKERVHGEAVTTTTCTEEGGVESEDPPKDETELLLMGDHYHVATFRKKQKEEAAAAAGNTENPANTNMNKPLPEPLKMSKDKKKVDLLRTAFQHLAKLKFWEQPDYDLIGKCIRGFLEPPDEDPVIQPIDWKASASNTLVPPSPMLKRRRTAPRWDLLLDGFDPIDSDTFPAAEAAALNDEAVEQLNAATTDEDGSNKTQQQRRNDSPWSRLPVEMRFRLEQMAFHVDRPDAVSHHIVLRDWLNLVLPLLYEDWDARKFEDGGHRTSTDGYRREHYLKLLRQCQRSAETFNFFRSPECFYVDDGDDDLKEDVDAKGTATSTAAAVVQPPMDPRRPAASAASTEQLSQQGPPVKKRKIASDDQKSDLITLSRALIGLRVAIKAEDAKRSAPPMRISFA